MEVVTCKTGGVAVMNLKWLRGKLLGLPSWLVGYGIYGCVSVYPRVRAVQREFVDFTKPFGEALWKKYVGLFV